MQAAPELEKYPVGNEQLAILYADMVSEGDLGFNLPAFLVMHILRALRPYAEGCQRVALVAPLSFDASVQQLAVSIFCGKSLYVASDEERKNPALFCECARERRIDLCDMVGQKNLCCQKPTRAVACGAAQG